MELLLLFIFNYFLYNSFVSFIFIPLILNALLSPSTLNFIISSTPSIYSASFWDASTPGGICGIATERLCSKFFFTPNRLLSLYWLCYYLAQWGKGVPCPPFPSFATHLLSVVLVFFFSGIGGLSSVGLSVGCFCCFVCSLGLEGMLPLLPWN